MPSRFVICRLARLAQPSRGAPGCSDGGAPGCSDGGAGVLEPGVFRPYLPASSPPRSTSAGGRTGSFSSGTCRWCSRSGWHRGTSVYLQTPGETAHGCWAPASPGSPGAMGSRFPSVPRVSGTTGGGTGGTTSVLASQFTSHQEI